MAKGVNEEERREREKELMIREYIRETRERKKNNTSVIFKSYTDVFNLTNETVEIISWVNKTTVKTQTFITPKKKTGIVKNNVIMYPITEWTGLGTRWDIELADFLKREIRN